jgi:hypothetical protein
MDYNNLDAILERVEKFNKTSDDIYNMADESLYELTQIICYDKGLIKILKIASILKTAYANELDFDAIKNIDSNFVCDGDKIIIKFNNWPIEYILTYDDELECLDSKTFGLTERYALELYNFLNCVIDNIENFEQKFIKKLNNILQKQDSLYNEFNALYN